MTRVSGMVVVASLISTLGGCSSTDTPGPVGPKVTLPRMRLMNLGYSNPTFDLKVDNATLSTSTAAGKSSGYHDSPTYGEGREVSIHLEGVAGAKFSSKHELKTLGNYSVFVFGPSTALSSAIQYDQFETTDGKAHLRFVHGAPDFPTAHIKRYDSDEWWSDSEEHTGYSDYRTIDPGVTYITLVNEVTPDWFIDYEGIELEANKSYTVALQGTFDSTDAVPLQASLFTDDVDGSVYRSLVAAPQVGKLSFVNAFNNGNTLSVKVDGNASYVPSLAYGQGSTYGTLPTGKHQVSVSTLGSEIISPFESTVKMRKAQTVVVAGDLTKSAETIVLNDITKPNISSALVRFINLSTDTGRVDLYTSMPGVTSITKVPGVDSIQYKDRSSSSNEGFVEMTPATVALIVHDHASDAEIFTEPNITLAAGGIYTVWIGGSRSSAMKAYIIKHN